MSWWNPLSWGGGDTTQESNLWGGAGTSTGFGGNVLSDLSGPAFLGDPLLSSEILSGLGTAGGAVEGAAWSALTGGAGAAGDAAMAASDAGRGLAGGLGTGVAQRAGSLAQGTGLGIGRELAGAVNAVSDPTGAFKGW